MMPKSMPWKDEYIFAALRKCVASSTSPRINIESFLAEEAGNYNRAAGRLAKTSLVTILVPKSSPRHERKQIKGCAPIIILSSQAF